MKKAEGLNHGDTEATETGGGRSEAKEDTRRKVGGVTSNRWVRGDVNACSIGEWPFVNFVSFVVKKSG